MEIDKGKLIINIRKKEWSMGNGQCPECCGLEAGFNGHLGSYNPFDCGHSKDCSIANSLTLLGEDVLYTKPSKCIKVVCMHCNKDITNDLINKYKFTCPHCGEDLFFKLKCTYEEITDENN